MEDHETSLRQLSGDMGQLWQKLPGPQVTGDDPGAAAPAGTDRDLGAASAAQHDPPPAAGFGGGWSAYEASTPVLAGRLDELRVWMRWANPALLYYRASPSQLVPDCWEKHPGVVEELLGLYAAWRAAYVEADPTQHPAYWHGVFLGPTMSRLFGDYQLTSCREQHRDPIITIPQGATRQDLHPAADAIAAHDRSGDEQATAPAAVAFSTSQQPDHDQTGTVAQRPGPGHDSDQQEQR